MTEYRIDDDIKAPTPRVNVAIGFTSTLKSLGIDQSFFIPGWTSARAASAARGAAVKLGDGRQFMSRNRTEDGVAGVRIWRVK